MSNWSTSVCEGYRTKTIQGKRGVIEIMRPILSDSEVRRREDEVREAIGHAGETIARK